MLGRHVLVHPFAHGIGGDAHGTANADGRKVAAFKHAAHGAGGDVAELTGGLVEVP
jgi:hypothetical protein